MRFLPIFIFLVIVIIVVLVIIKSKKVWSVKKILLTFLVIGFIGGLLFNSYILVDDMNDFTNYYVNHTHDEGCYSGGANNAYEEEYLDCYVDNMKNKYENAFDYAFDLDYTIISMISLIGISEVLAGLILLVRSIKKSKVNQKIKEEKISNSITNILD